MNLIKIYEEQFFLRCSDEWNFFVCSGFCCDEQMVATIETNHPRLCLIQRPGYDFEPETSSDQKAQRSLAAVDFGSSHNSALA